MLKGIVFDLDGTLIDSLSVTFASFNHGIVSQGGKRHSPEEIMTYFGPGEGEIFAKILGREKAKAAYQACMNYLDENLEQTPLHQGVAELLETLKSRGIPISIFTGRSWNTTEILLKHHRLLDQFVTVVANDHVDSPKPSPEGLLLSLRRMNLDPSEAIFVGDSPVDLLAARAAGTPGVAALWDPMADRDSLARHSPAYWAQTPARIWEIWQEARLLDAAHVER